METEYRAIYVTAPDEQTADRLARVVVERRLAACANIIPGMRSVYWWNGNLESAEEIVVIFKTRAALVDSLTDAVKKLHPYECPCIVTLPITGGNPSYLQWINMETDHGLE